MDLKFSGPTPSIIHGTLNNVIVQTLDECLFFLILKTLFVRLSETDLELLNDKKNIINKPGSAK